MCVIGGWSGSKTYQCCERLSLPYEPDRLATPPTATIATAAAAVTSFADCNTATLSSWGHSRPRKIKSNRSAATTAGRSRGGEAAAVAAPCASMVGAGLSAGAVVAVVRGDGDGDIGRLFSSNDYSDSGLVGEPPISQQRPEERSCGRSDGSSSKTTRDSNSCSGSISSISSAGKCPTPSVLQEDRREEARPVFFSGGASAGDVYAGANAYADDRESSLCAGPGITDGEGGADDGDKGSSGGGGCAEGAGGRSACCGGVAAVTVAAGAPVGRERCQWEALPLLSTPRCFPGAAFEPRGALLAIGGGTGLYTNATAFETVEALRQGVRSSVNQPYVW